MKCFEPLCIGDLRDLIKKTWIFINQYLYNNKNNNLMVSLDYSFNLLLFYIM